MASSISVALDKSQVTANDSRELIFTKFRTEFRFSDLLANNTTLIPDLANWIQIAFPSPLDAPVTT